LPNMKKKILITTLVLIMLTSSMVTFGCDANGEDELSFELKVEGIEETILDSEFQTEINDEELTALDALTAGLEQEGIEYEIEEADFGPYVHSINGDEAGETGEMDGWMFEVNEETPETGADEHLIEEGDLVFFFYHQEE